MHLSGLRLGFIGSEIEEGKLIIWFVTLPEINGIQRVVSEMFVSGTYCFVSMFTVQPGPPIQNSRPENKESRTW